MIDVDAGIAKAMEYLAMKSETWESEVRVIVDDSFRDGSLLIVPYDTVEYVETGDDRERLAGNYPVCVDLDTGECCFVGIDQYKSFVDRGFFG
jgi:hypothetical protein